MTLIQRIGKFGAPQSVTGLRGTPSPTPSASASQSPSPNETALLNGFVSLSRSQESTSGTPNSGLAALHTYALQNMVKGAKDPARTAALLQTVVNLSAQAPGDSFAVASSRRAVLAPQRPLPAPGQLPPPRLTLSGPPAGRGLSVSATAENGWPAGTIKTAGGYRIVAEGKASWSIYGPEQRFGEKPLNRVWGDPRLLEREAPRTEVAGSRADNTSARNFVLPDGTRILAETNADAGVPLTTGLVIAQGADRVAVTDLKTMPRVGAVSPDGHRWRTRQMATFGARVAEGAEGPIMQPSLGSRSLAERPALRSGGQRPPMGTASWGNSLRAQLDDALAHGWTQRFGPYGGSWNSLMDSITLQDAQRPPMLASKPDQLMGGWAGYFEDPFAAMTAIELVRNHFARLT